MKEVVVIFELRSLLLKHQPDICFSFFIKPVIYGTIAAWSVGVKRRYGLIEGLGFAFTPAVHFDARRWIVRRFLMLMARFSFKRLSRIIFLNPDDRKEFLERDLGSGFITKT